MKPAADHPLQLVLGFAAWLLWFCVAYGGLSVACSVAPPPPEAGPSSWVHAALLVLTLATAGALALAARTCHRAWRRAAAATPPSAEQAIFIPRAAAWLHGAAALATLVVGLPMVALPACV